MSNIAVIDASKARNNFFKLLDDVFTNDKTFVIRKAGITVAKLEKAGKPVKKMSVRGIEDALKKTFGSFPDFPDVADDRVSRKT